MTIFNYFTCVEDKSFSFLTIPYGNCLQREISFLNIFLFSFHLDAIILRLFSNTDSLWCRSSTPFTVAPLVNINFSILSLYLKLPCIFLLSYLSCIAVTFFKISYWTKLELPIPFNWHSHTFSTFNCIYEVLAIVPLVEKGWIASKSLVPKFPFPACDFFSTLIINYFIHHTSSSDFHFYEIHTCVAYLAIDFVGIEREIASLQLEVRSKLPLGFHFYNLPVPFIPASIS